MAHLQWYYAEHPKLLQLHRRDPMAWLTQRWGGDHLDYRWSQMPQYTFKKVWDGTPDPLWAAWMAVSQGRKTAVESATSIGKTHFAAQLAMWFLDVYMDAVVPLVDVSETHFKKHLWKDMRKLEPRMSELYPGCRFYDSGMLKMSQEARFAGWGAWFKSAKIEADADSSTGMQGTHAPDMLHIIDEGAGIASPVYVAIDNTSTALNNPILALGNPNHTGDALHQFATQPDTVHIIASALDHPNVVTGKQVIPGAVTRPSIISRRGENGENVLTNMYQSRIRGRSPEQGELGLFHPSWFDAALLRGLEAVLDAYIDDGYPAMGIDVARSKGGDKAAVATGTGALLEHLVPFHSPNASHIAYNIVEGKEACKEAGRQVYPVPPSDDIFPEQIGVDVVGVGASTVEAFANLGWDVTPINGGAAADKDKVRHIDQGGGEPVPIAEYGNLRAQIFFTLAEDLRLGRLAFHPRTRDAVIKARDSARFIEERVSSGRRGKMITSKDDFPESPNELDALAYWNWVRKDRDESAGGGVM
jgi:hypothetical protein